MAAPQYRDKVPAMSGGWVGYIYVFFGCGIVLALLGGSTLVLYAWARYVDRRGARPMVRVTSLPPVSAARSGGDGPDASSTG